MVFQDSFHRSQKEKHLEKYKNKLGLGFHNHWNYNSGRRDMVSLKIIIVQVVSVVDNEAYRKC